MPAPLEDITVIEIDNWMAAPSAGAILADMGARVIKIEPLRGDPMRNNGRPAKVDGLSDYDFQFDVDSRGKESVCMDLTNPEAQKLVLKLCEKAEIFLCNLLLERQQKYQLDPATVMKSNPSIVHATLTGYGTSGPDAWRPGYDVTAFFGRSGLYDAMREGDTGTVPMARPAQGDHTAGLALVGAILGGLRVAEKTGTGQAVETSLFETAVWTQASDYCTTAVDEAPVRKRARDQMLLPTANRYPCGDGKWIVFNMPEASGWPKFCHGLGKPEWLEDERFVDPKGRYRHMHVLVPEIDEVLSTKGRDEWGKIFDETGLIWGPVLGLHEVPSDQQAQSINLFPLMHNDEIGEYRSVSIPMRFHNAEVGPKRSAPATGEHTRATLEELGLTNNEIESMLANQVIA